MYFHKKNYTNVEGLNVITFGPKCNLNDSFQARVVNSIPGLIHANAINTKPNRIFSFFIPFPIPWGVIM